MSWYEVVVQHDRMRRGLIVYLEDTQDVANRLEHGLLQTAEKPDWAEDKEDDDG